MPEEYLDKFDQIYRKDPSIVARQIAGEMILVPIRQSLADLDSIYLLNETALATWQLIDGNRTLAEILGRITAEFEVERQQAADDLLDLVEQMEKIGAVVKV